MRIATALLLAMSLVTATQAAQPAAGGDSWRVRTSGRGNARKAS